VNTESERRSPVSCKEKRVFTLPQLTAQSIILPAGDRHALPDYGRSLVLREIIIFERDLSPS
jgi:hypothetical protein